MLDTLRRTVTRRLRPYDLCECRRCGTAVDRPAAGCPSCGSRDLAFYDL